MKPLYIFILSGVSFAEANVVEGSFDYGLRSASPSAQDDWKHVGWVEERNPTHSQSISHSTRIGLVDNFATHPLLQHIGWVSVPLNPTYRLRIKTKRHHPPCRQADVMVPSYL